MNDNMNYDVVIVGAGAAGLASAAYLCRYGYSVLLCEKNDKTGGLVGSFNYNNFIFDAGIRAFENSGIILPMLKQLGIDIKFIKNPVSVAVGHDIVRINSMTSLDDYQNMLIRHFPDNAEDIRKIIGEIKKVIGYMDVLYGIDNPLFLDDILADKVYLYKTLLPWLIKYGKNIKKASKLSEPINDYLQRFTSNRSLIDIITQHFFKNTPAFFALSYFIQYSDYMYPAKGTGVLSEKLHNYIEEHGGIILTGIKITGVDTDNRKIISSDNRHFGYKKLIWACSSRQLSEALHENDFKNSKQAAAWKNLISINHGGDSILSVFLGLDMDCLSFAESCGAHCFYTPETQGINISSENENPSISDMERIKIYLKYTTYEISCPVLRDTSLAPSGKTGLIVSTLMDYNTVQKFRDGDRYDEFKKICQETILDILDCKLVPGIKKNLLFSLCSTPLSIENIVGSTNGAITGWAFTDNRLPAETRFKKITNSVITPFKDIYQAGQWSFSPSGLPTCLLTGKLAADKINKKLRKKADRE